MMSARRRRRSRTRRMEGSREEQGPSQQGLTRQDKAPELRRTRKEMATVAQGREAWQGDLFCLPRLPSPPSPCCRCRRERHGGRRGHEGTAADDCLARARAASCHQRVAGAAAGLHPSSSSSTSSKASHRRGRRWEEGGNAAVGASPCSTAPCNSSHQALALLQLLLLVLVACATAGVLHGRHL